MNGVPKGKLKRLEMNRKGTLVLNADDLYSPYHILNDAELVD